MKIRKIKLEIDGIYGQTKSQRSQNTVTYFQRRISSNQQYNIKAAVKLKNLDLFNSFDVSQNVVFYVLSDYANWVKTNLVDEENHIFYIGSQETISAKNQRLANEDLVGKSLFVK